MKIGKWVLLFFVLEMLPAVAGDYEAVVDDTVIGYWRFNDPNDYGKDASGHGSGIVQFKDGAEGGAATEGKGAWARGGGCLVLPRNGTGTTSSPYTYGTAVATVTSGNGFDLDREEPGWTIATWIRGSSDLVKSIPNASSASSGDAGVFRTALEDGNWHPMVIVYRPTRSENEDFYRVYLNAFDSSKVTVLTSGGTDDKGKPAWHIPLSVTNGANPYDTVTLGGTIGGVVKILIWEKKVEGNFFGCLDDCIIINHVLAGGEEDKKAVRTDDEVFRLVQTGETFIFTKGSSGNMFYEAGNWSNSSMPLQGRVYMIENGCEVKSAKTWKFYGKSLSVGRTEKLYGITSFDATSRSVIVDNTVGKLTQATANTTMTVDELVLNDGVLTSLDSGQVLSANIRVRASASKPFKIAVSNGTYKVTGTMKGEGDGCVDKVGSATLDLSALTEASAKVSLSEGSLRLASVNPTLSGYSGGTLLVDFNENAGTATTVAVDADWTGSLAFRLNGRPSKFCRYAALTVPVSVKVVTAADFANQTECADGLSVRTEVVSDGLVQTVFVECLPVADLDASPVLIFE